MGYRQHTICCIKYELCGTLYARQTRSVSCLLDAPIGGTAGVHLQAGVTEDLPADMKAKGL